MAASLEETNGQSPSQGGNSQDGVSPQNSAPELQEGRQPGARDTPLTSGSFHRETLGKLPATLQLQGCETLEALPPGTPEYSPSVLFPDAFSERPE